MTGKNHENGWVITPDMVLLIERYVELVRSFGGDIHTERFVRLNRWIAGTPDSYAIVANGTLYVIDLKYGYAIVEPFQNTQISIYAGAIVRQLASKGVTIKRVVIGVYQPRPWHPAGVYRTWSVYPEKLMEFVRTLEAAGERCQNPNPVATPGTHCTYCPAKTTCHANAKMTYAVAEQCMSDQQANMKPVDLAQELEFLETAEAIITSRRKAVRAEATARVRKGEVLPGWHLEHPLGDRQFKADLDVVQAVTGIEPYQKKPMTPAAVEKLSGVSAKAIAALTYRPHRPPVLKKIPGGYYENMFK